MNILSEIISAAVNGDTITLEKDRIYHVRQDDCITLNGYYCSNTAKKHENPNGRRDTAIFLKNKKDITIDGNGASLIIHGKMTPFLFDNCENISVINLTVDYACPTMSEFRVLSNNHGECVIRINDECLYRIEDNTIVWMGEDDLSGKPYWQDCHNGNRRHFKIFDPSTDLTRDSGRADIDFESVEEIAPNTLKVILKNKNADLPQGVIVQTRNIVRDHTGSLFQNCKNLFFRNLHIRFMHGLGMVSQYCENICYRDCFFTPSDGRTVASTADFFQFSGCKGNIILENIEAKGAHDDYVNVHGTHLRITERYKNQVTVRFMHDESWGFDAFFVGDTVDFIRYDTLIPYFTSKVTGVKRLNDTDILLTLDAVPDSAVIGKDVLENATYTPNLTVRGCRFGSTSGRGILCTTRGRVVIENNHFEKLWGPALLIEDDCNFWFESGYTTNISFIGNTVDHCDHHITYDGAPVIRYTPKVLNETEGIYVHKKLTVKGNKFRNPVCDSHSIHLEHLCEAIIENNSFDATFNITSHNVGSITDRGNTVSTDNEDLR